MLAQPLGRTFTDLFNIWELDRNMHALEFLKMLESKGAGLSIEVPNEMGSADHPVTAEDVLVLMRDPTAAFAKALGVSVKDYLGWVDADYCVICAGYTAEGHRCKNMVKGGYVVSVETWAKMRGEYCHVHG